jgi:integrase
MGRRKQTNNRVLGPYQRKDGLFGVVLRGPGKPDQWEYFQTKRKALLAKAEMESVIEEVAPVTLGLAVEDYRNHLLATGRRKSTYDEAGWRLGPLVRIAGEYLLVQDLKRHHLEQRLLTVPSIAGKDGTLVRMRHFCQWLLKAGLISRDPSEGLEIDGVIKKGKPQLTRVEARKFVAHLWGVLETGSPEEQEKALAVLILVYCGLREGELLRLQVRDIDLDATPAVVQVERVAKTKAGFRDFEVPDQLAEALKVRVKDQTLDSWVWPSNITSTGHRCASWVLNAVKKTCKAVGVTVTGPQGLRGTHARLARKAGVTSHAIAEQLGHESEAVTIGSYVGKDADEQEKGRRALHVLEGGRK